MKLVVECLQQHHVSRQQIFTVAEFLHYYVVGNIFILSSIMRIKSLGGCGSLDIQVGCGEQECIHNFYGGTLWIQVVRTGRGWNCSRIVSFGWLWYQQVLLPIKLIRFCTHLKVANNFLQYYVLNSIQNSAHVASFVYL